MGRLLKFFTQASKSKTVIVNTLMVIVGIIGYLEGNDVIINNPELLAALLSAAGVINVILRFLTVEPVSEKKQLF